MHEDWGWMNFYEAALLESDPQQLPVRIARARREMQKSLRRLRRSADQQEREYLLYAENNLCILETVSGSPQEALASSPST